MNRRIQTSCPNSPWLCKGHGTVLGLFLLTYVYTVYARSFSENLWVFSFVFDRVKHLNLRFLVDTPINIECLFTLDTEMLTMWLGRWFSFFLFVIKYIGRCTHPRRPWPGAGHVLEPCCSEQPQGGARGWTRCCRGSVVPLSNTGISKSCTEFCPNHALNFEAHAMVPLAVFQGPSYCDPLGGSGAWNLKGLRCFFEPSQLWWYMSWHQNDQFRVQLGERFGMILSWPGWSCIFSIGWFSPSNSWQFRIRSPWSWRPQVYLGVSLNGGTPILHPTKWDIFSRKTHGPVGETHHF